jgi:CspA family cold shock protein
MASSQSASTSQASTSQASTSSTSTSGRVKWFNNKAGYGFITLSEGDEERDIFVHHTEIQVGQSQYKYLVQGEYVEFTLAPIARDNKPSSDIHATQVRGVNGGKLMCETRNEVRTQRAPYVAADTTTTQSKPRTQQSQQQSQPRTQQSQQQSQPRAQQQQSQQSQQQPRTQENRRPQLDKADQVEWMIVPRRRLDTAAPPSTPRMSRGPRQAHGQVHGQAHGQAHGQVQGQEQTQRQPKIELQ